MPARTASPDVQITPARLRRIQPALLAWHETNGLRAPWRESADPYHCLLAAVMAQQTQMSRVLLLYERFLAAFPTIEALAAAPTGDVIRAWAGMGYNRRAVQLHRAARQIASEGWPRDAPSLAKVPGIGPFTAAIIASFAFGQAAACVDTNMRRVLGRIAGDESVDGARLQRLADAALAADAPARWNQAVMDYGARVCTPRPKCGECVVARWCASRERFALRVAEPRANYVATRRRQPAYEGSPRMHRGRIIDALRALPPGGSLPLKALAPMVTNGDAPSDADLRVLVDALVRDGLVVVRRGRVSLPD
jgi:A/G-specific adenine glycosylase